MFVSKKNFCINISTFLLIFSTFNIFKQLLMIFSNLALFEEHFLKIVNNYQHLINFLLEISII